MTEARKDPAAYPLAAAASDEVRELAVRYGVVPVSEEHWELTRRQSEMPCNAPGTDKSWVEASEVRWLAELRQVWKENR